MTDKEFSNIRKVDQRDWGAIGKFSKEELIHEIKRLIESHEFWHKRHANQMKEKTKTERQIKREFKKEMVKTIREL